MLIFISSTASYAQTLRLDSDTVHCYDREDMRSIALRVIEATECDTVIDFMRMEIAYRDSIISASSKINKNLKSELELTNTRLEDTEQLAKNFEEELAAEAKKHKGTKFKWYVSLAATVIIMTLITK